MSASNIAAQISRQPAYKQSAHQQPGCGYQPGAYLPRSSWPTRCTDDDGDLARQCGSWACENTNFRAASGDCHCCCIIGERSGDRKEGECTIRISNTPTSSPDTSSPATSSLSRAQQPPLAERLRERILRSALPGIA
eukprot:jgi/Tetstr1/439259/TSEL_027701.t1